MEPHIIISEKHWSVPSGTECTMETLYMAGPLFGVYTWLCTESLRQPIPRGRTSFFPCRPQLQKGQAIVTHFDTFFLIAKWHHIHPILWNELGSTTESTQHIIMITYFSAAFENSMLRGVPLPSKVCCRHFRGHISLCKQHSDRPSTLQHLDRPTASRRGFERRRLRARFLPGVTCLLEISNRSLTPHTKGVVVSSLTILPWRRVEDLYSGKEGWGPLT